MLIDTLPFEVTRAGHYQLAASLQGPPGDFSLKISAPAVTLDLAGFTLQSQAEVAILLNAPEFSLRNGRIAGSVMGLVAEPHVHADHCILEDLEVEGGLFVGGSSLLARRCQVKGGTYGLKAGVSARISDCEMSDCLIGLEVGAGSEVLDCRISQCEEGVYAYGSSQAPCHLKNVLVLECRGLGLRLDGPGVLESCEAHNNGREDPAGGILAGPAATVKNCQAYGNQGGDIAIVDPCELSGNRTSDGS
jgi:hypothetical protein